MQKPLSAGSGKRSAQVLPAELSHAGGRAGARSRRRRRRAQSAGDQRGSRRRPRRSSACNPARRRCGFLLKEEFAVILLDVLMPGLDGYETARLIRQREQSKRTPIIFLTAINKEDAHMLRGYDAGAVDYVFKPFDPVMLRSKVDGVRRAVRKDPRNPAEGGARAELAAADAPRQRREAGGRAGAAAIRSSARRRSCARCRSASMRARIDLPFGAHFVSDAVERLTGFAPERFTSDADFGLSRVHPDDLPCREGGAARRQRARFLFLRVSLALRRRHLPHLPRPGRHVRDTSTAARPKSWARCSTSPSGDSSKTG